MQKFLLATKKKPLTVDLGVAVQRPCRVRVQVFNPDKPSTVYYDRWKDVDDKMDFKIKMPQSGETSRLIVGVTNGNDDSVRVTKLRRAKLDTHAPCLNGNGGKSARIKEFLKFAQEFCENAAVYDSGTYFSDKKNFRIDYFPMITENGRTLSTPARIHNGNGNMELSSRAFIPMTVPMRMAVILHEHAHFNLNEVQEDEIEADLNALKIYLGAGYPIIEAHKGFLDVFKTHPSDMNRERYEYLKNFIDNFEENKYRLCLP
jgi:hypothetical protein